MASKQEFFNMGKHRWATIQCDGWKTHVCHESMIPVILEDIGVREPDALKDVIITSTDKGFIDLPGMVSMDRTYQKIEVDGLELEMPTTDFEYFLEMLRNCAVRSAGKQKFYKIHGWLHCVVLTPLQRYDILEEMASMLPGVRTAAEKERLDLDKKIKSVNDATEFSILTPRDDRIKLTVEKDGTVSAKVKRPLSGTPTGDKN
jgi:hypothetical protein